MRGRAREIQMMLRRRLTARLGLDGNPLRRGTDRIAACGAAGLLAVFLAGAPVLSVAAGHWVSRAAATEQHGQQAWREVMAELLQVAPVGPGYYAVSDSWALARWTFPDRGTREGLIPAAAGMPSGSRVRIWVDASGRWAGLPLSPQTALFRVAGAVVTAPAVLAAVLLGIGYLSRRVLDWRRLAGWEADWNSVGPRWTRQLPAH
jgi:hypothetical protein